MSVTSRTTGWALVALLAAGGCKQADRISSAPPTRAELPALGELEPSLPILVGVEGAGDAPRVIFVPRFEKIELTPEEREIVGEEQPHTPDVLAFYQPPPRPEDGVSSELFMVVTGIGGVGGALVARDPALYPRFGQHGTAGHHAYPHVLGRQGASVGRSRDPVGVAGRAWLVQVGRGPARTPARHASRSGQ